MGKGSASEMKQQTDRPALSAECKAAMERVRRENEAFLAANGRAPRVFVLTFGCQQNEADSEKLLGLSLAMGYEQTDLPDKAELILVNTCAIREHAEQKALSTVGQYKHLKAKNPALLIGVCGCMVTQEHRSEELKRRYPYVDFILGTASQHRLPQVICKRRDASRRVFDREDISSPMEEGIPIRRASGYRAWVSIMYGCNNFCSYCIVPYVRGRERSRDPHAVIAEVRALVAEGYRDITLLGQNVNSYGKDRADGYDFADLLRELDRIEGDFWLRFMTSHPKDAGRKLIDVMAESRHVAHQFHLPLQSGSDGILKAMNRHYDTARYLSTVDYLRERIPDVTITSDIIVGFPGESEEDFEGTLAILRRVRFDMLYSFIYSPRKGTPAAAMEQIPRDVQGARFDRLLQTQNAIGKEQNQPLCGRTLRVLCDGESKTNPALCSGRTEGNKIVFFEAGREHTGRFVNVRIDRADAFALYGERQ